MSIEEILNKIHDIKLYNVSYREYYGVIDNYIIGIYPFVTEIIQFHKDMKDFIERKAVLIVANEIQQIMWFHHMDYIRHDCDFDPCILYENVTSDHIHTHSGPEKNGYSKDYYKQISLEFNSKISLYFRKEKLKKLNTIK